MNKANSLSQSVAVSLFLASEPRLSVLDFVSQFWRKIGGFPLIFLQRCETKFKTESLGTRLVYSHTTDTAYLVRILGLLL